MTRVLPNFVTFTGVDERTDMAKCMSLSKDYPIEWGVLISTTNTSNRYPSGICRSFLLMHQLRFSGHLCGRASREFQEGSLDCTLHSLHMFDRVQINSRTYDTEKLRSVCETHNLKAILQHREGDFPQDPYFDYLLDRSGGIGKVETRFPSATETNAFCGYAGGLSVFNVNSAIDQIKADRYWLDMESSLRDDDDWFDVDKCRAICEKIWG